MREFVNNYIEAFNKLKYIFLLIFVIAICSHYGMYYTLVFFDTFIGLPLFLTMMLGLFIWSCIIFPLIYAAIEMNKDSK